MHCRKFILGFLMIVLLPFVSEAQCPDFMELNSDYVTGYYGNFYYPFFSVGIVDGRHTLITQQGMDPRTGNHLPLIPDGETVVIKLGNEQVGAQAESLIYTFTVDPDNSILLLKYAVVLQNPGHQDIIQPRFLIQMLNADDELLSECMEYNVISSDEIPGFQSYGQTMWRPWTLNGFDLSPYAGQTVKLQVSTFDCGAGAHYGYAYFTATCMSNRLSFTGCDGQQVTVSAPEGFESYSWNNGSTSSSTTYTLQGNTVATCVISTVTGCQLTLMGTFTDQDTAQDQVFFDTICEGASYHHHGFDLPPQVPGDFAAFNTFFNISDCDESATSTLYLHVLSRYTHIYDVACEGDSYNAHGFHYDQLPSGQLIDSNIVQLPIGCDHITMLHLTVNQSFSMPNTINGPTEVCEGTVEAYSLENTSSQASNLYLWTVPDEVIITGGQGTSNVQLFFMQDAPSSVQITLTGSNGCGSGSTPLEVVVHPAFHNIYSDTVCLGSNYEQYGFQLDVQDSMGLFVHIINDTTQFGCDSVSVLQLLVADTPYVVALADPSLICVGGEAELHAVSSHASVTLTSQLPRVWVGDILCTDSSFVHPQDWPCEKVPMGVVFYVDNSGEHGWAVNLQDENSLCKWGTNAQWPAETNNPNLPDCSGPKVALYEHDGYQNTFLIRDYLPAEYYPAAYSVDFENGWYLPAAGQAYHLYATIPSINPSLLLVGGTPFPTDIQWTYWTSSEINSGAVWVLDSFKGLYYQDKNDLYSVRGVRSF